MKAAFKKGQETILKDVQLRPPGPGEIRLKIQACGICGTDLHVNPDDAGNEAGFGHEIAGTVAEVGPGVLHLKVGQAVALDSSTACGQCDACRNAQQELCSNVTSFWPLNTFGFAEEMLAPAISALPYEGLTPEVACLQEPLGVAIDMLRLADITPSSNVLVIGPGPIGLMALALARRAGARRVFLVSRAKNEARIRLARKFGADDVIEPDQLVQHKFGCIIDRVLSTTPPVTLSDAMAVAGKGGIIVFIGLGFGSDAHCRFEGNAFHFKKLQLRASFASPALFGPRALQYLKEGVIDGEALISHRFKLADIAKAMAVARDHKVSLKVVVTN